MQQQLGDISMCKRYVSVKLQVLSENKIQVLDAHIVRP